MVFSASPAPLCLRRPAISIALEHAHQSLDLAVVVPGVSDCACRPRFDAFRFDRRGCSTRRHTQRRQGVKVSIPAFLLFSLIYLTRRQRPDVPCPHHLARHIELPPSHLPLLGAAPLFFGDAAPAGTSCGVIASAGGRQGSPSLSSLPRHSTARSATMAAGQRHRMAQPYQPDCPTSSTPTSPN